MIDNCFKNQSRTIDGLINEKIKVLSDFYIVDANNEDSIRNMLLTAVKNRPNSDPIVVIDGVAKRLISEKL